MFPTRHAVERFQERVAPVTTADAARRIREAAASSKISSTPRRWTPVSPAPGLGFIYPEDFPGVCFLVRNGAVLTVMERSLARRWTAACSKSGRTGRRPTGYQRPAPGDSLLEAA